METEAVSRFATNRSPRCSSRFDRLSPGTWFAGCVDAILQSPVPFDKFPLNRLSRIRQHRRRINFRARRKIQRDRELLVVDHASPSPPSHTGLIVQSARRGDQRRLITDGCRSRLSSLDVPL